jgi:opacity protein-like surface antigen
MRFPVLVLSLASAVLLNCSRAADLAQSWYFHAGAGGNWAEDLEAPSVSYEFQPGYRVSLGPGVQIGKYLAVEIEMGLLWNDVDQRITAAGTVKADGEFWRAPLLVNFIGRYPIGKFVPRIGIGIGGVYEEITATAGGIKTSDYRVDSAFQGLVGLDYSISERISVGVNYKYMRTIVRDDDWFIYFGAPPEKPEDHGNHSVTISVRCDF